MRLLSCNIKNFGSFKDQDFYFDAPGVTLIYGPTGSGKSTICDVTCWILYGTTAKDISVDDVRSWTAEGSVTQGTLTVQVPSGTITVTRVRGTAKENDLYWQEELDPTLRRGKDLTETQKLLEDRLSITSELYQTTGYYNEFSSTSTFFISKAKERRVLLEQVAALSFPVQLYDKLTAAKKISKKTCHELDASLAAKLERLDQAESTCKDVVNRSKSFDSIKSNSIKELQELGKNYEKQMHSMVEVLQAKSDKFDHDQTHQKRAIESAINLVKLQIRPQDAYLNACPTCRNTSKGQGYEENLKLVYELDKLQNNLVQKGREINPFLLKLQSAQDTINPHVATLDRLKSQDNPFKDQLRDLKVKIKAITLDVEDLYKRITQEFAKGNDIVALQGLTNDLKAHLLTQSIQEIQSQTNTYLQNHFDSELRVLFELEGSDSLNISISKNDYKCVYKQLSKGQRCLLKVCFSLSVMKVAANRGGIHIDTIFLDEAFDGCDSALKEKAFGLLQSLNADYRSIFIVDHEPAFQNLFENRIKVSLEGDISTIEVENE